VWRRLFERAGSQSSRQLRFHTREIRSRRVVIRTHGSEQRV
jgi:hypothetical protein